MWYGKGPGVDRTGDIFKHANFAGVGSNGGVLALGGDDPLSKSSTLPTHSEVAFYDALFPVLFPGNVQEILDLGRLGFELSRYSGLWVGFKIVTNVADEIGTAEVGARPHRASPIPASSYEGRPWQAHAEPAAAAALRPRDGARDPLRAAGGGQGLRRRQRAQPRSPSDTPRPGSASPPPARPTTTCARRCASSASTTPRSAHYGIRLLKIGMLFPMEPGIVREFARGLEEILVVEEKRAVRRAVHPRHPLQPGRAARASWASATSRAARWCPPTASSTPTASPSSWPRRLERKRPARAPSPRGWRCWRRCASGRRR